MAGPEFLQQAVLHRARLLNDYWHLPEYPALLDELQQEVSNAIAGTKTVQQALADAAEKNERTLERAGYEIKRGEKTPEVPDKEISPVGQDEVVPVSNDPFSPRRGGTPVAPERIGIPHSRVAAPSARHAEVVDVDQTSTIVLAGRWLLSSCSSSTWSTTSARSSGWCISSLKSRRTFHHAAEADLHA